MPDAPDPVALQLRKGIRMPEGRSNPVVDLFGDEGSDFRWMTYGELGQARGITVASARSLAYRRNWRRQAGNDRTMRVAVPLDEADQRPGNAATDSVERVVRDLESAVATLREQLERERARADEATEAAERAAARVTELRAVAEMAALVRVSLERALTAEEAARAQTEMALEFVRLALAKAEAETAALHQVEQDRSGRRRFDRIKAAWRGK
jgi:hypothetical protein